MWVIGALGSPRKKAPSSVRPLITPVAATAVSAVGSAAVVAVAVRLGTAVAGSMRGTSVVMMGGGAVLVGKTAVSGVVAGGETGISAVAVQAVSISPRRTNQNNRRISVSISI